MHITFQNEQLFHISDYPWADPSARMAGSMQAGSRCSPCSRCAPPRRAPFPSGGALARLAHGRRAEVAGACGVARGGASGAAGEAACGRVRMQPPGAARTRLLACRPRRYAARRSRLGATRGGVAAVRGRGHQHRSDARRAVHAPSSSTPLMLPPASAPARSGSSAPPASVSAASSAALASPLDGPLFLPNFSVPWKLK